MLTQAYLEELFEYEPETGVLRWKLRPRHHFTSNRSWNSTNGQFAGKSTGDRLNSDGYHEVGIDGSLYKKHRVIWILVNGQEPIQIDHINGIRHDNRIENLRNVSRSENLKNKRLRKDNVSGVSGVTWHKIDRRWIAQIRVDGKLKRLGGFKDIAEAVAARKKAEKLLGYHENHGKSFLFNALA